MLQVQQIGAGTRVRLRTMSAYGYGLVLEESRRRQLAEARHAAKRSAVSNDDVRWCWESGPGFASRVSQCLPQRCSGSRILEEVLADLQARLAAARCSVRPLRVAMGDVEVSFPNLQEAVRALECLAGTTPPEPVEALGQCTCAVCLEDLAPEEALWRLPCGHGFHPPCVHRWLLQSRCCPNCRGHVGKGPITHELCGARVAVPA